MRVRVRVSMGGGRDEWSSGLTASKGLIAIGGLSAHPTIRGGAVIVVCCLHGSFIPESPTADLFLRITRICRTAGSTKHNLEWSHNLPV